MTSSGPRTPGSATLVRLVAAREVSSRIRDKNFVISSVVILLLLLGTMAFQVVVSSGEETSRVAVVADDGRIGPAVEAQGEAVGVDVEVVDVPDAAAARDAVEAEEVDAALVDGTGPTPELLLVDRDPRWRRSSAARSAGWPSPTGCSRSASTCSRCRRWR